MLTTRIGPACFAGAGVLFILYPATRPWNDETADAGALASMGSGWWLASHTFAIIGFILLALGVLSLRDRLAGGPGARAADAATLTAWLGAGLVLPYYGGETFGLFTAAHASGVDLVAFSEAFRWHPLPSTLFLVGLLLLAATGVLIAVSLWRHAPVLRSAGIVAAVGLAWFAPQFYTPPPMRIAHGVVLGCGLILLGLTLLRTPVTRSADTRLSSFCAEA